MARTRPLFSRINRFRENYNPLVGLTMERVVALQLQGQRGELTDLQWLYHSMIGLSDILLALRIRRESSILKLNWCIKTPEGTQRKDLAKRQAAVLQQAYEQIDNMRETLSFLALAEFTGFAHLNKHRDENGDVYHFEPLDPWNWMRDGMRGEWLWNPTAERISIERLKCREESHIQREEFVIREVDYPILQYALADFVRSNMAKKDWAHFVEIYGIPGVYIVGPPNVAADKEEEFKTAAEDAAEGGSGYLPNGSDVKVASTPFGRSPYKEYLEDIRTCIVRVGTGGKLTMMNDASGLGGANANAHEHAFMDIAEAEALKISETLQQDFDREILEREFPGQPPLAYFELSRSKQNDITEVTAQIEALGRAGYRIDEAQVSELTAFKIKHETTSQSNSIAGK